MSSGRSTFALFDQVNFWLGVNFLFAVFLILIIVWGKILIIVVVRIGCFSFRPPPFSLCWFLLLDWAFRFGSIFGGDLWRTIEMLGQGVEIIQSTTQDEQKRSIIKFNGSCNYRLSKWYQQITSYFNLRKLNFEFYASPQLFKHKSFLWHFGFCLYI